MENTMQVSEPANITRGYYCICGEGITPICGFGSVESAIRYRMDDGQGGTVRYFDLLALMEYGPEVWL